MQWLAASLSSLSAHIRRGNHEDVVLFIGLVRNNLNKYKKSRNLALVKLGIKSPSDDLINDAKDLLKSATLMLRNRLHLV